MKDKDRNDYENKKRNSCLDYSLVMTRCIPAAGPPVGVGISDAQLYIGLPILSYIYPIISKLYYYPICFYPILYIV
jgi:hypothetical protein